MNEDPIVPRALIRKSDLVALLKTNEQMYRLLTDVLQEEPLSLGLTKEIEDVLKEVKDRFT